MGLTRVPRFRNTIYQRAEIRYRESRWEMRASELLSPAASMSSLSGCTMSERSSSDSPTRCSQGGAAVSTPGCARAVCGVHPSLNTNDEVRCEGFG